MFKNLIFLLASVLLLANCTEVVKPTEEETGRDYFPIAVGNYWIYDVVETTYTNQLETTPGDSIKYQVRDRVTEVYNDQTSQQTFKIIRSRRASETQSWTSDSIVLVNKSLSSVLVTSNNLKTVPLVFPITNNKTWNGNAFNTRKPEEYTYASANSDFPLQDKTFINTVKVIQVENKNAIEADNRQEVYANKVGLIYRYVLSNDYCSDPATQGGCSVDEGYIVRGKKRVFKIREYKIVK